MFSRLVRSCIPVGRSSGSRIAVRQLSFNGYTSDSPSVSTDSNQRRVSLLAEIPDTPGSLMDLLRYFWKYDINMCRIDSRPTPNPNYFRFYIDFVGHIGEPNTDKLITELKQRCKDIFLMDHQEVPWFPVHISDLDLVANRTLDAGADLESDHPGFHDPVYRARRTELAAIAENYKAGEPIPYINYTADETATWGKVFGKLEELTSQYACQEYQRIMPLMKKYCGYSQTRIPQVEDISNFLKEETGFQLRPVAGLLSSRDFLNGLAFRTFFSTQYIRHSSRPLYTPEPDICHELIGHAPMFADKDFADFSQEIGLASLGASDADIKRLATCYWFTVEFGLLKEDNRVKAYGAGILSSFGELQYSCSDVPPDGEKKPDYLPFDPDVAAVAEYPITTYQPKYFVAESLSDVKVKMRKFAENMQRPFHARYNHLTKTIWVDRAIHTKGEPPKQEKIKYGKF